MKDFRFFSTGFEWGGGDERPVDLEFFQYKDVTNVKTGGHGIHISRKHFTEPTGFVCDTSEEALEVVEKIRERMAIWLDRDAVKREEARVRHAALLAELRKLTERMGFEPEVGEEALDAVERCKKRVKNE